MFGSLIEKLPIDLQKKVYLTVRYLLSVLFRHSHSSTQKDILLFSTRRGGSTLLGQMLSANRGIRNIDQPLTLYAPNGIGGLLRSQLCKKYLPQMPYSQYVSLTPKEQKQLLSFMDLLISGELSLNPWLEYKASGKKYFCLTDRVMLKITDANAIIDWFVSNFDSHIIYLIRHPIPNALSITKNRWMITVPAYLDNKRFSEQYLNNNLRKISKKIMDSKNYFLQGILNWCVENVVPLKYSNSNFLTLSYEELVLSPMQIIQLLSERFNLNDTERMHKISGLPSYSTSLSDKRIIENIKKQFSMKEKYDRIISRWRQEILPEQEEQAMELLNAFGIEAYKFGSAIPHEHYLHFPDLLQNAITK